MAVCWAVEKSDCEAVKERYHKIHNLLDLQAQTISHLKETGWNREYAANQVNERTTRQLQQNMRSICAIVDDLIATSTTGTYYRKIGHPSMPMLDESLAEIRAACDFMQRPLPREMSTDEYMNQRVNMMLLEEQITNLAHKNVVFEHILVDRDRKGHNMAVANWQTKGFKSIHYFYEALLNKDADHAMALVHKNRQVLQDMSC